jgi:hypothetical protein
MEPHPEARAAQVVRQGHRGILGTVTPQELVRRFDAIRARVAQFGASAETDAELEALADEAWPLLTRAGELAQVVTEATRLAYDQAGAPYGPGDEAMWRWARDQAGRRRAERKAEEDRAWRDSLENLRRRALEQRRN